MPSTEMGKTVACEGYGLNCVHVAPRRPPSYAEVLTSSPSEWDIIGNRVLPHSSVGKNMYLQMQESACQCGRLRFDPWVGKIPWRRKWQPTPVFLPGKSHGQRSLVGYNPWDRRVRYGCSERAHSLDFPTSIQEVLMQLV